MTMNEEESLNDKGCNMDTDTQKRNWCLTETNHGARTHYIENNALTQNVFFSNTNFTWTESTPVFQAPCNSSECDRTEMEDLCEQLGSVELIMTDSARKEAEGQLTETFDSSSIFVQDKDGDTLLHTAIILREITLAMLFIAKAPSYTWLAFKNLLSQTPLHLAVLTDQPEITRRLVVAGAAIDVQDRDGNTALHIACRQGQQRNVQYLLEPVRYHETKQNTYEIPFQTIPQDFSVRNYEGLTCLHLAAMNGHLDVIETLLDKDIEVNLREGKTGRTILHNACFSGDINLVKLLLRHRTCNINARAFDGSTPFDIARARGHEHVCMLLAAAGASYGDEFNDLQ